jgi:hypothetical protein
LHNSEDQRTWGSGWFLHSLHFQTVHQLETFLTLKAVDPDVEPEPESNPEIEDGNNSADGYLPF